MKVLILGGSGYIGRHLSDRLNNLCIDYQCISRYIRSPAEENFIVADTKNKSSLVKAMTNIDVVINCVAGDFHSISEGATCLVDAALEQGKPLIIHMSSMKVYGNYEGIADENTPLDPTLDWYAQAKCMAETQMHRYCSQGGRAVILRPGCVYGKGSVLWVGRFVRWLKSGRIGDLGVAGDGWTNLVHVEDVVTATLSSLKLDIADGVLEVFNLAAPDSPRWNNYFIDLALSINAIPVRRVSRNQLLLDSYFFSPPAKLIELFFRKLKRNDPFDLNPLPPNLIKVFNQQIKLDSTRAEMFLFPNWVSYQRGMNQSLLEY